MLTLSIRQPWAWLSSRVEVIESRVGDEASRPILVHA
jgi:hypothetical protein